MPEAEVAFAWGSQSTSSVFLPDMARAAARFTAVVVLPTPPFWLDMLIICVIIEIKYHNI